LRRSPLSGLSGGRTRRTTRAAQPREIFGLPDRPGSFGAVGGLSIVNNAMQPATLDETTDIPQAERVRRAVRELEAAQARVERDAQRVADDTREKLVAELLPVLDNLDRVIGAGARSRETSVVEGVRLVRAQLEAVLRGYGVERIDAVGSRFDPNVHDALSVIPVHDPARHGIVVDQLEPGYRAGDRLLRAAKVVVGQSIA
jgi:molecular chaperone GrpE